ncbi:MAG: dynamin family protein [Planctomycetota bacterium]|jgi:GTPase Era involved in 16S rRNA processing
MRTQLSEFCQDFNRIARPVLAPLEALLDAFAENGNENPLTNLRAELSEIRHQLSSLVAKVEDQQAFVLIFGPLKSGKSTLMNAIAASYVSEVSSLPAYPCLVFVSHASKKEFVVTDYAGKSESFADADKLHKKVEEAHAQLADSMRKAEESGDQFDPQEHLPTAIRRADIKVPAKNLAESGAVLVDTPGLYTRMRFGYDRMTQEFRNSAACAIFVVKSDTLFLEQVFSEFHQLLELFSRIFLVVNMDTAKRDVGPDGELVPSLEQKAPESIISAFEKLAMTAPIKKAASEGTVRIYPVDLMNAARVSLQKSGKKDKLPPGFIAFRDDLKEYLESVEYLKAFLGDSMFRAQGLAGELRGLSQGEDVAELHAEAEDLQERKRECDAELERIADCLNHSWSRDLARFAKDITAEINRRSPDLDLKLGRAMSAAIDTWFLSGHSLGWLIEKQWKPLLEDHRNELQMVAMRRFEESCVPADAGVDLSHETTSLLRSFDIEIRDLRKTAQHSQGKPRWDAFPKSFVDVESIPVKRSMVDILAFRSVESVRNRLFGSGRSLEKKITAKVKASRLGEAAKQFIRAELNPILKRQAHAAVEATRRRFCEELEQATATEVERRLKTIEPDLRSELEQIEAESRKIEELLAPVMSLRNTVERCLQELEKLSTRYAKTDPDLLLQPLDPAETQVEITAKARKKSAKSRKTGSRRAKRRSGRGSS